MTQRHLVAVWNPSYEADAMEQHLSVLLAAAARHRAGECDEDEVFVWWGKIRSANRQQPIPHLDDILSIDAELGSDDATVAADREVHLYLTDFRSLYVAHVGGITADDMRDDDAHVPAFYAAQGFNCDCWFQLWDVRRVVSNDTLGVVEELKKLRNTRYNDRPVSIYGGMVAFRSSSPAWTARGTSTTPFVPRSRAASSGASSTPSEAGWVRSSASFARTSSATKRGVDSSRPRGRFSHRRRRRSATIGVTLRSTSRRCSWISRRRSRCREMRSC